MNKFIRRFQQELNEDFTSFALRAAIIIWALIVILAALFVRSKWVLAAILAWELLP